MKKLTRDRVSDHFCECLLTNLRYDRLGPPFLAEVRHQEEHSGQTLLA